MNEIKPCPNPECGAKCELKFSFGSGAAQIICSGCGYQSPMNDRPEEAIRLHNLIPRIPEGYVVVPKEPTAEIIKAMEWQIGGNEYHPVKTWGTTAAIYKVAIEAAQEKHDETHPA